MKNDALLNALAAAAVLISLFSAAAGYRVALYARDLAGRAGEAREVARRSRARAAALETEIQSVLRELEAAEGLPVSFAESAEALKAAVEQCALSTGVGCSVAAGPGEEPGVTAVEAAFRASPERCAAFVRAIMRRREFFVPLRMEWRALDDDRAAVEIGFAAPMTRPSDEVSHDAE